MRLVDKPPASGRDPAACDATRILAFTAFGLAPPQPGARLASSRATDHRRAYLARADLVRSGRDPWLITPYMISMRCTMRC